MDWTWLQRLSPKAGPATASKRASTKFTTWCLVHLPKGRMPMEVKQFLFCFCPFLCAQEGLHLNNLTLVLHSACGGRCEINIKSERSSCFGDIIFWKRTQKMVLDAALLNTQYYEVRIKGKVAQSREKSNTHPYTLVV